MSIFFEITLFLLFVLLVLVSVNYELSLMGDEQVHLATLKSTGERVVVKVQRPGLKELFDIDLKNLRVIASQLNKFDPKTDGAARDWTAVYDECARVLYEEIDYTKEAENATAFANNFKKSGIDWVKVPEIYQEATTSSILTMEYCPGLFGFPHLSIENSRK